MKYGFISLSCLIMLASCHKKKDKPKEPEVINTELARGFPENSRKIHGYLYAGFRWDATNGQGYPDRLNIFAAFGDPARNLMMNYEHSRDFSMFNSGDNSQNVNVGAVTFNNVTINNNFSTSVNYSFNNSNLNEFITTAKWRTFGNGSFIGFQQEIPWGLPAFTNTMAISSNSVVSKTNGFEVRPQDIATNYDSMAVMINFSNLGVSVRKAVTKEASLIKFLPSELISPNSFSSVQIQYELFNYSNKTINNKVYVFELSNKVMPAYAVFQ